MARGEHAVSGYAWAALGLIVAGTAAYAADKRYGDRIRHAIAARRFRRDMDRSDAAAFENALAETMRQMRESDGDR